MEMEDEGQLENWIIAAAPGCVVFGVLVVVIGMLLWWVITGVFPTFGLI